MITTTTCPKCQQPTERVVDREFVSQAGERKTGVVRVLYGCPCGNRRRANLPVDDGVPDKPLDIGRNYYRVDDAETGEKTWPR